MQPITSFNKSDYSNLRICVCEDLKTSLEPMIETLRGSNPCHVNPCISIENLSGLHNLHDGIDLFLNDKQQKLLFLTGDEALENTNVAQALVLDYWNKVGQDWLPVYVPLSAIPNLSHGLLQNIFAHYGIDIWASVSLKNELRHKKIFFIFDHHKENIAGNSELSTDWPHQYKQELSQVCWDAKYLFVCRKDLYEQHIKSFSLSYDRGNSCHLLPFRAYQTLEYIDKFFKLKLEPLQNQIERDVDTFEKRLKGEIEKVENLLEDRQLFQQYGLITSADKEEKLEFDLIQIMPIAEESKLDIDNCEIRIKHGMLKELFERVRKLFYFCDTIVLVSKVIQHAIVHLQSASSTQIDQLKITVMQQAVLKHVSNQSSLYQYIEQLYCFVIRRNKFQNLTKTELTQIPESLNQEFFLLKGIKEKIKEDLIRRNFKLEQGSYFAEKFKNLQTDKEINDLISLFFNEAYSQDKDTTKRFGSLDPIQHFLIECLTNFFQTAKISKNFYPL